MSLLLNDDGVGLEKRWCGRWWFWYGWDVGYVLNEGGTGLESERASPETGRWKFFPETEDPESREDSIDGNGSRSGSRVRWASYDGGGVSAFWRGDAVYDRGWNGRCDVGGGREVDWNAGGNEARLLIEGADVALPRSGGTEGECGAYRTVNCRLDFHV